MHLELPGWSPPWLLCLSGSAPGCWLPLSPTGSSYGGVWSNNNFPLCPACAKEMLLATSSWNPLSWLLMMSRPFLMMINTLLAFSIWFSKSKEESISHGSTPLHLDRIVGAWEAERDFFGVLFNLFFFQGFSWFLFVCLLVTLSALLLTFKSFATLLLIAISLGVAAALSASAWGLGGF